MFTITAPSTSITTQKLCAVVAQMQEPQESRSAARRSLPVGLAAGALDSGPSARGRRRLNGCGFSSAASVRTCW